MTSVASSIATSSILVIRPNHDPQEVQVAAGTTVAQLAAQMGVPDAARMAALDEMGSAIGPNDPVTGTSVVSFCYKLAGA